MTKKNVLLVATLTMFLAIGCGKSTESTEVEPGQDHSAIHDHSGHDHAGHDHGAHDHSKDTKCDCAAKKALGENFWCEKCTKGFVDGKEVGCKSCYEGKTGKNVWCEKCNKGYVGGEEKSCKGCIDAAIAGTKCEKCAA